MMNTASIRFRMTAWYAGLLATLVLLFSVFIYFTLQRFLENRLRETLAKEAQTIGEMFLRDVRKTGDAYVVEEIEEHLSPRITGHFIRVTRPDASVLYESSAPENGSFDPSQVSRGNSDAPAAWREEHLSNGMELLIHTSLFADATGQPYLLETGAPYEEVERVLQGLLTSLGIALPLIVAVSIVGGYFLMRHGLKPLDHIVSTAERITSRNLNERIPVPATGDELEKLSVSLNQMMGRLEEAFHHISRFSADAAHEIRTPLAIIRGELEAALQIQLQAAIRDRIQSALEEVDRLTRIVEQLLEMSRLEAGEVLADRSRFDFAEMTRTTVDQMRLLAEEREVYVRFEGQEPIEIEGDRIRLKQVVVNLVDNAIKYSAAREAVSVKAFRMDGKAILEVADSGVGIPREAVPHIFDRFYRVDKARSRQLGGTGLGLAIVKSICAAYGGSVTVQSVEGRGATFRVELPIAADI
jgi:heavy metal sensor kinase